MWFALSSISVSDNGVFSKRAELLFLVLASATALGLGFEILVWNLEVSAEVKILMRVIGEVFLLGTTHTALSFSLLWNLPELREWSRQKSRRGLFGFWVSHLALFGTLFASLYFLHGHARVSWPVLVGSYFFIESFFRLRHMVQQFKGISLQYNHEIRSRYSLDAYETIRLRRAETRERKAYNSLIVQCLILNTSVQYNFFFSSTWAYRISLMTFLTSMATVYYIVRQSKKIPHIKESNKRFFHSRLFFLPFMNASVFAGTFLHLIHGLEFTLLASKMVRESKASRMAKRAFWAIGGVLMAVSATGLLVGPDYFGIYIYGMNTQLSSWVVALIALDASINLSHYYFDARMFRFKDPVTRDTVGALLQSSPSMTTVHELRPQPIDERLAS